MNKRGSSRISSEVITKVGEFVVPILGFLVVFAIVISAGSSRGPQTYFLSHEYANVAEAMSVFDGRAMLKYVATQRDFVVNLTSNNLLTVNTLDGKAPNARSVLLPDYLELKNQMSNTGTSKFFGQARFFKNDKFIAIQGVGSDNIDFSTVNGKVYEQFDVYTCADVSGLERKPIYLERDDSPALADLISKIKDKGVEFTTFHEDAGIALGISYIPSTFSSVLITSDDTQLAKSFACNLANELKNFETIQFRLPSEQVSVVLVPSKFQTASSSDIKVKNKLSYVSLEVTFVSGSQDSADLTVAATHNNLLTKGIVGAYDEVYK